MSESITNEVAFPQFRKYKNEKSYFRIDSPATFEEIKAMPGGSFKRFNFEAKILPDRNFIYDMLFDYAAFWEAISEAEYRSVSDRSLD